MSKSIRTFFSPVPSGSEASASNKRQRTELNPTAISPVELQSDPLSEGNEKMPAKIDWPPMDNLEPGWRKALAPEYDKLYFKKLLQFLATEAKSHIVYPPANDVFTALNLCPLDKIKVVIIGQDPYHGPNQAHGLAFSVQGGVAIPPSLRNMIKEAMEDEAVAIPNPSHGNLSCWSKQGVLLLNTSLTVRKANANSHQNQGWEIFTDAIIKVLAKKKDLVYLLWGKPAQGKCKSINTKQNTIITSSHPSPLAAYKTNEPFMGSRCFSRCNTALEKYGKEPINWSIE